MFLGFWQLCSHSYDWWRAIYSWTFWYCRWKLHVFYNVLVCNYDSSCWSFVFFGKFCETSILADNLPFNNSWQDWLSWWLMFDQEAVPDLKSEMSNRSLEYPVWMMWKEIKLGETRAYIRQAVISLPEIRRLFNMCVCIIYVLIASYDIKLIILYYIWKYFEGEPISSS